MEKIQISEEQARGMLGEQVGVIAPIETLITMWKEKGFIKKSAIEEAREYYVTTKKEGLPYPKCFDTLYKLYELAYEEK